MQIRSLVHGPNGRLGDRRGDVVVRRAEDERGLGTGEGGEGWGEEWGGGIKDIHNISL